ncbi:MAG TPA: hypothetical protein VNM35_08345 [Chitinophagaceae bacterium]|jgi:hypothetical protein|nr:hypothetical protein [Chitinophagaceae bacterium]
MRKPFLLITLFLLALFIKAQNNSQSTHRLKVFIDCSNTWCDQTFIKTEINIVDFLLDNQAADLHILITEQSTGSGGSQYQLIFFGQNQFKNQSDTLRFITSPNATDFEERDILIKYLKLGLAPFIAKTSSVNGVIINMKQENTGDGKKDTTATKDPWNYWVLRVSANGNINADEVYKSLRYSGRFTASRVTDELKLNFSVNGSKDKTTYEYETTTGLEKFTVDNNYYGINHSLIKSINSHWSYGYEANITSNTFSNIKRMLFFRTGFEYDIFPYKDVNNKFFTISYTVDVRHNKYYDTTLYEKTQESLGGHSVEVNLSFNQKWGNLNIGASYHNYFHNWKYFNMGLNMYTSVRISGGLSFNVGAFGGLTRDQIYLPKGGATEQEVLTRRRQLASGYNYYTSFGLSYRFGSKLSNFVNPRFEGGGGYYFD